VSCRRILTMRIPTVQLLSDWLKAHLQSLQHWTDPTTGRVHDPFESHQYEARVPSGSHSPATGLFVVAIQTRRGQPEAASLLQGYCRRVLELLADNTTPAATAAFLQYFGLLAIRDLKAVAAQEGSPIPAGQVDELAAALCAYRGAPEEAARTHVMAMLAGVEILRFLHSGAADWGRCIQLLNAVGHRQGGSGFLNDDPAGPSAPVAYHMLSMHLLAAAASRAAGTQMPDDAQECLRRADHIASNGYGLLGHLLANDGMIAQCGNGRYHPFAQAAGAAILAATGVEVEDACVRRFLNWMDHYRLAANASAGLVAPLFAVTPNFCPPALRVGFEDSATVAACNNLAGAILADALGWWTGELPQIAPAAEARKTFFNAARARGCHADAEVGLVCLRGRYGYVLVNLETDFRGTTPAGSLIHLRLGDDLHEKSVAPPFWADPRVSADMPAESVWEGPLLCPAAQGSSGAAYPPAFLMQGRTTGCQTAQSSIALQGSGPDADWAKTILLEPAALSITWRLQTSAGGQALLVIVPCVLWDGALQTQLRFEGAEVRASRCGHTWRMIICDRQGKPLPGSWSLPRQRGALSISGVTGQLLFPAAKEVAPGVAIDWSIRIELLPA
jgi:hypothetical protein